MVYGMAISHLLFKITSQVLFNLTSGINNKYIVQINFFIFHLYEDCNRWIFMKL